MADDKDIFLIQKLGENDMTAMEFLYVKYAPQVKSFVYAFLKNEADTEDLVHDIFLKIWEERNRISRVVSFKSYLYSMTKNMVYNKLKKSGVHSRFVDATRSNQANQDPEKKIITRDLLQHIHKEMGKLPKQQRDIYEMNREEDLTYNEISDKLGISPKTVQYHIGKVLIKLKKTISS